MTGRSENVQDTHRSSMVDQRHLEQHSLRPVSREPHELALSEEGDEVDEDAANAASNEQQAAHPHQQKY